MIFAGQTDKGTIRSRNEDFIVVNGTFGLFIVADGIGGLSDGHVASRIAAEETNRFAEQFLRDHPFPELQKSSQMLSDALTNANRLIYQKAEGQMGATCLVALIRAGVLSFAHAGDCKLYLLRRGGLRKLNREHSLVRDLIDDHTLGEDEARTYKYRNVIKQAVGIEEELNPETGHVETRDQDRFILTTDGIPGDLTEAQMVEILTAETDPASACDKLIEEAKKFGGRDNLTVICIDQP